MAGDRSSSSIRGLEQVPPVMAAPGRQHGIAKCAVETITVIGDEADVDLLRFLRVNSNWTFLQQFIQWDDIGGGTSDGVFGLYLPGPVVVPVVVGDVDSLADGTDVDLATAGSFGPDCTTKALIGQIKRFWEIAGEAAAPDPVVQWDIGMQVDALALDAAGQISYTLWYIDESVEADFAEGAATQP